MKKSYYIFYLDPRDELDDRDRSLIKAIIYWSNEDELYEKIEQVFENNKIIWSGTKEGHRNIYTMQQSDLTNVAEY